MAFTQAQLDAINRAIASGTQTVEFSGPQGSRRLTYRSIDELMKAKAIAERELGLSTGSNYVQMSSEKGTC
jgi:hypothetical protein